MEIWRKCQIEPSLGFYVCVYSVKWEGSCSLSLAQGNGRQTVSMEMNEVKGASNGDYAAFQNSQAERRATSTSWANGMEPTTCVTKEGIAGQ